MKEKIRNEISVKNLTESEVKMGNISDSDYVGFFAEVKERIRCSQYEALRSVNKELINLYWDIGRMIVEKQQHLGWGKSVVEQLSEDIRKEYPGLQGFSTTNLWNMRLFYSEIQQNKKLQPLVGEIQNSHQWCDI